MQTFGHVLNSGCFSRNGLLAHVLELLQIYCCHPRYYLIMLCMCIPQSRTDFFLLQLCRAAGKGRRKAGCWTSSRALCVVAAVHMSPLGCHGSQPSPTLHESKPGGGVQQLLMEMAKLKSSIKVKQ